MKAVLDLIQKYEEEEKSIRSKIKVGGIIHNDIEYLSTKLNFITTFPNDLKDLWIEMKNKK